MTVIIWQFLISNSNTPKELAHSLSLSSQKEWREECWGEFHLAVAYGIVTGISFSSFASPLTFPQATAR